MATSLPLFGRRVARGSGRVRWGHARGVATAFLAVALAALVSASAARNETLADPLIQGSATAPGPAAAPVGAQAPQAALGNEPDIEAIAGTLARRYRVSQEATRELVGDAFGEGRRIGLDPLLILAVMAVESRFNPIAQSNGGAMGLMQVIPRYHAAQFASTGGVSVLDPRTNIGLGARVLKDCIRRGGTETAGLQLYNGAADDPSSGYANKVLGERQRLQEALRRAHERSRA